MDRERWVISDTHFFHDNIIKYCNRPFVDSKVMNECLVSNWNAKVKPGDIIYHLGDVVCGSNDVEAISELMDQLNGEKHHIIGNHDKAKRMSTLKGYFQTSAFRREISVGSTLVVMEHYPLITWPDAYTGRSVHLFGHCHNTVQGLGRSCDVGVDAMNFEPVNLDEIVAKLMLLPVTQKI